MKKKIKQKKKGFDENFDSGEALIDFSFGTMTEGLSKTFKLPPMDIPVWLSMEIERLAKFQANSKAAIVRQLLVEAIQARQHHVVS